MHEATQEFAELLALSDALLAITDERASQRTPDDGWSKKEILGHLIDSASNNHQRFVRLQMETGLRLPSYTQDAWVRTQNYQGRNWADLVTLWLAYNRHLAHVVQNLNSKSLGNTWHSSSGEVALEFIIVDYLRHLRHHLKQILEKPL